MKHVVVSIVINGNILLKITLNYISIKYKSMIDKYTMCHWRIKRGWLTGVGTPSPISSENFDKKWVNIAHFESGIPYEYQK
jgi:hypothetical protein